MPPHRWDHPGFPEPPGFSSHDRYVSRVVVPAVMFSLFFLFFVGLVLLGVYFKARYPSKTCSCGHKPATTQRRDGYEAVPQAADADVEPQALCNNSGPDSHGCGREVTIRVLCQGCHGSATQGEEVIELVGKKSIDESRASFSSSDTL